MRSFLQQARQLPKVVGRANFPFAEAVLLSDRRRMGARVVSDLD
jgi:hypothetical protein